ncbi:unnamed protein product [Choristocarpus tenellus]
MKRSRGPPGDSRGTNSDDATEQKHEGGKRGKLYGNPPLFRSLLNDAGVDWRDHSNQGSSGGFHCCSSPAKIRVYLEGLVEHDQTSREEFVQGLVDFLTDPQNLRRALLPLILGNDQGVLGAGAGVGPSVDVGNGWAGRPWNRTSINTIHESLVKVFLRVDCIQPQVIDILLEKLPEVAGEEGDGSASSGGLGGSLSQVHILCTDEGRGLG